MGQNKHVGLEINKGHGQLDKTFNKDYSQSFRAVCLAGISSFYITTRNYTTAVASHVTKASNVTQSSGEAVHSDCYTSHHAALPMQFSQAKSLITKWLSSPLSVFSWVRWLHSHSLVGKQDKALKFQGKKNTSFHLLAFFYFVLGGVVFSS